MTLFFTTDFELMLKNNYVREPNLQKYRSKHTQVPYLGPRHFEKFHLTVHMYSYQFLVPHEVKGPMELPWSVGQLRGVFQHVELTKSFTTFTSHSGILAYQLGEKQALHLSIERD